jgi:hypothetical protein
MFPLPPESDPDAYSVTVTPVAAAKGGVFTLNMDGNWERVARSRPVIVNSIAPAVPLGPINKTLLGMVVTSALTSLLMVAAVGGMIYWAFSK